MVKGDELLYEVLSFQNSWDRNIKIDNTKSSWLAQPVSGRVAKIKDKGDRQTVGVRGEGFSQVQY